MINLEGNISSSNCNLALAFNASSMNFEVYYRSVSDRLACQTRWQAYLPNIADSEAVSMLVGMPNPL